MTAHASMWPARYLVPTQVAKRSFWQIHCGRTQTVEPSQVENDRLRRFVNPRQEFVCPRLMSNGEIAPTMWILTESLSGSLAHQVPNHLQTLPLALRYLVSTGPNPG